MENQFLKCIYQGLQHLNISSGQNTFISKGYFELNLYMSMLYFMAITRIPLTNQCFFYNHLSRWILDFIFNLSVFIYIILFLKYLFWKPGNIQFWPSTWCCCFLFQTIQTAGSVKFFIDNIGTVKGLENYVTFQTFTV